MNDQTSRSPGSAATTVVPGGGIVRNFMPSWFAAVMGTGALVIDSFAFGQRIPVLRGAGELLHWFNVALFIVLLLPWTLRWIRHRDAAIAALRNPLTAQFYPTVAVALVLLAVQFLLYGQNVAIASVLWCAGAALTFLFSVLIPMTMFRSAQVTLDHVTPGMFIPPVALVVVPLAGNMLTQHAGGTLRELILLVDYASLGSGFFLYLALLALSVHRLTVGRPLPGPMVPTLWINLGPIGVSVVSVIGLVDASPFLSVREPFYAGALLLWGFGMWWLVLAAAVTLGHWRRGDLPFSLTWWAFTFPLGAFAAANQRLAAVFRLEALWWVGLAVYALLVGLWCVTLAKTLIGAARGTVFVPPPHPAPAAMPKAAP